MKRLRLVAIAAETNLFSPLQKAAAGAELEGLEVRMTLAHTPDLAVDSPLWEALAAADAVVVSMINTDGEARRLAAKLAACRPAAVLVVNSQPELMTLGRLYDFDALTLAGGDALRHVARAFQRIGVPLPPMAHVVLAALGKVWERIPADDRVLAPMRAYGRAMQYWTNPSPENLKRLFHFLAAGSASPHEGEGPAAVAPPIAYPPVALWHPDLEEPLTDIDAYRSRHPLLCGEHTGPVVGAVLFRQFVLSGNTAHYRGVFEALEGRGIAVIGGFATLDNTPLIEKYFKAVGVDLLLNLTGFNLVGSMGRPNPGAAVRLLQDLDVPYLVAAPLLFQAKDEWLRDPLGLHPAQVAIQVVTPELEGGIEPRVYGGRGAREDFEPIREHCERLAGRVERWIRLRRKTPRDRRVALTIFSFPPDKGSIGTAAYLDVFQSLHTTLSALEAAGYEVEVPRDAGELQRLLTGSTGRAGPGDRGDLPLAGTLSREEYCRLVPFHGRIARHWGPAPGNVDVCRGGLAVRGRRFGNVFIGIQPGFGYEGDPMRLLLEPDTSPSHSFAAYYAWVRHVFGADILVHFGTHGALEFMPGKQVGLTPECFPDALVGDLPHAYVYSVNNPSEATIAKRRSAAVIVSHLSPPLSRAGLYKDLAALREALREWKERTQSGHGAEPAWQTVLSLAERAGFGRETWPSAEPGALSRWLGARLDEIEARLIPIGLHVIGRPLGRESLLCHLTAEAQAERGEGELPALGAWIVERLGAERQDEAEALLHAAVGRFVEEGRTGFLAALRDASIDVSGPEGATLERWIARLGQHRALLSPEGEQEGLLAALAGRYVLPSPGGDPVRVPDVLPTGRNMHALDPFRIPSAVAQAVAKETVAALLTRHLRERGAYPHSVAVVLWGTDNIKNHGESVAQVLALLGVRVKEDSLGRMTRLELIPLEELGRPRIDVVMTVSGIFRDIFGITAALLQEAVDLAAAADEPLEANHVRRRILAAAARLETSATEAGLRVFSNNPGHYGTGVNHVVDASDWEERDELARLFIRRKSHALGRGRSMPAEAVFAEALRGVQVTLQSLDSPEIGVADVDHYYEYLGGLNAAVEHVNGSAPAAYIADTLGETPRVRSLAEEVALECRTKLLNPKWYKAMLDHGYQGVHEIAVRLENTFGWSATSDAVPAWVYDAAARTFAEEVEVRARMQALNPQAYKRLVGRLLEAEARGYWSPTEAQRGVLESLYEQIEALEEGIV